MTILHLPGTSQKPEAFGLNARPTLNLTLMLFRNVKSISSNSQSTLTQFQPLVLGIQIKSESVKLRAEKFHFYYIY